MLQAFPCATQPHAIASTNASGPTGAWKIAITRIPPFISKPQKIGSRGGGFSWFAAFMRIRTSSLAGYAQTGSGLLVTKPLSKLVFSFSHVYLVSILGCGCQLTHRQKTVLLPSGQRVAPLSPNTLSAPWTDILPKSIQN